MRKLYSHLILCLFLINIPLSLFAEINKDELLEISVYKSRQCGCCAKWIQHLEQNGFKVTANNIENLSKLKDSHKIPKNYRACHTAVIGQYIVEGHVPANIIKQLVNEQPLVKGITVPGMPVGAPGMESSDPDANQSYEVFSFSNDGEIKVYADIN
ncbi:MAG: DUF411 domain-containing protein [Francisellaceae bacterium]|jgi:hypothetical protein|nr:DUF411 domain-containing protein [Francisellaceae bacterium]MBT6538598.1 DUF411 domain-containing protein [Francisellaceae bacterium]